MKIMFIGTGSMSSGDNPACYLINDHIMFDMPNGIVKSLMNNNLLDGIDTLLISHAHGDHFFDVPFLLFRKYHAREKLDIYASSDTLKKIKKITKIAFPSEYIKLLNYSNFSFRKITNKFVIDNISINPFLVYHGILFPSYGFTFKDDKVVSFSGDSRLCKSIIKAYENSDYLICDCTMCKGTLTHMGVNDIEFLLNKKRWCKIIPTHMSPNSRKKLKKIRNKKIIIKKDYEVLEYE